MRYLFFDTEWSNNFDGVDKMCEFGYVMTDEFFNVLDQQDYVMNPGTGRNNRFHLIGRINRGDLKLAHEQEEYDSAPLFTSFYEKISNLFKSKDVKFFGFSVANDMKCLSDNIKRYHLAPLVYEAVDVQILHSQFKNGTLEKNNLEKATRELCSEEEMNGIVPHRPDCDALMAVRLLKQMCESLHMEIEEFLSLCPEAVIDENSMLKKPNASQGGGRTKRKSSSTNATDNEKFNSLCDTNNEKPRSHQLDEKIFTYSSACKRDHINEAIEAAQFVNDNGGLNHRGSVFGCDYIVVHDETDKAFIAGKLDLTLIKAITINELYQMAEEEMKSDAACISMIRKQ